jgi:spermidine/putrescine transport system ATP-binding protein
LQNYLEYNNVTKQFGKIIAVNDVSLKIKKGEFFALLGPSGSGKTTLLRMTAGFEEPTKGDILIEGKSIINIPPYKRPVNMVFQNLALFPHLSVFKNISFGLELMKMSKLEVKKRVEEMLEIVRLTGYENRKIGQLSGGEQQRVALARALAPNPSVLLLDEPLANLDRRLRDHMQIELKKIHQKVGITFLYVTHDQESALTMADRIGIMHNGMLEQVGAPYEIYYKPKTLFIANFIGDTNIIDSKVKKMDGSKIEVEDDGLTYIVPRIPDLDLKEGDNVSLSLRPEKIIIGPEAKNFKNNFVGVLRESIFQGTVTRVMAQLPNGRNIIIKILGTIEYKVNDEVNIGWRDEDCKLLRMKQKIIEREVI